MIKLVMMKEEEEEEEQEDGERGTELIYGDHRACLILVCVRVTSLGTPQRDPMLLQVDLQCCRVFEVIFCSK